MNTLSTLDRNFKFLSWSKYTVHYKAEPSWVIIYCPLGLPERKKGDTIKVEIREDNCYLMNNHDYLQLCHENNNWYHRAAYSYYYLPRCKNEIYDDVIEEGGWSPPRKMFLPHPKLMQAVYRDKTVLVELKDNESFYDMFMKPDYDKLNFVVV
jgi:hypothetical protein